MQTNFILTRDYITLGQFLKEIGLIHSGGMAKAYLQEEVVYVDQEHEMRRGRKLYPGMIIELPDRGTFFMATADESNFS